MRNLKRALSLVMAMALIVGMMVISASAVSKDFTDAGEIDHTEAVNTMVALGVIDGKDDGSYFDPDGTLTRAEMAKVVAFVMNGGVEPNIGTKVIPTYSDIDNHWAEAYIEYCTSMGIISGDGAGKFNPGGPLTAEQTAKMFLTAMGYNAEVFGLVGANWAMNVGRYANEAGLYDELGDITPSQPISRDDACQMAYNAIQSPMMVRSWTQDQTTGVVTEAYQLANGKGNIDFVSLLLDKFDASIYEGVLGATGEYTTTIGAPNIDGFYVDVEKKDGSNSNLGVSYFEYEDQDLSGLMGQYVKAIYSDDTDTCYGVYAVAEKNTVVETAVSLTDYSGLANRVRIDGVVYNLETDIWTYNGEHRVGTTVADCKTWTSVSNSANPVKFIDNDGNGKFDLALITPMNVAEVTFVNDARLTMDLKASGVYTYDNLINGRSQELEDLVIDGDLAKGDFVVVTPGYYLDADTVVKTVVTSGTVTGVRTSGGTITDYQIEGVWYKPAQNYTVNSTIKSGSEVSYVGIDGVLYYAKLTSGATLSDVAVIYDMGVEEDAVYQNGDTLKAKIILSNGTTKEVTVAALYDDYADTAADNNLDLSDVTGSDKGLNNERAYIGTLMSYKVNNDGEYEFYALSMSNYPNNVAGMDSWVNNLAVQDVNGDLRIGSYLVADEAVIVVLNVNPGTPAADGKVTYVTGADFKDLDASKFVGTANASILVGKDADGFNRVMFAAVVASANGYDTTNNKFTLGAGMGTSFGYLVDDSWTETIDGSNYNCFQIWNGSNVETVKVEAAAAFYDARSIISYDVVGEGIVKNVAVYTGMGATWGEDAITAFSSSSVELNGTTYALADDAVILNVNDAQKTGVDGDALLTASEVASSGVFVKNARYVLNTSNEIVALVVDINNQLSHVDVDGINCADLNRYMQVVSNLTVVGDLTLTQDITVPDKAFLTVDGDLTNGSYSIRGDYDVTGNET